jgi:lipoate-protein ligase A
MKHCDLTLPTPEENLACDEALLESCEASGAGGVLRFWEASRYFVVVGYANQVATEVNLGFCRQHSIPVLRRCTGGGAVLQGPGCLNFSLVLPIQEEGPFHSIPATNEAILQKHRQVLSALLQAPVEKQGHTDLAIGGLKFCGNSQRRRRHFLLFHGSFLLHLDIDLLEKILPLPSKQPQYRLNRSHKDFLVNLKAPSHGIKAALCQAWEATDGLSQIPFAHISRLAEQKYKSDEWNLKF